MKIDFSGVDIALSELTEVSVKICHRGQKGANDSGKYTLAGN